MKSKWLWILIAAFLTGPLALVQPVRADDVPLKIAVVDPLKVATQVQEYKDLVEKVKADRTAVEAEFNSRKEKLKSMQDEIKLLLPNSDSYAEKNRAFLQYTIETEVWAKVTDMDEQRKQKTANKALFDKIDASIADICKDRGITLVISSHNPEIPDNMDNLDLNQLNAILLQRNVLYRDDKLDITQDVVIAMDKAYTSGAAPAGK